MSASESRSGIVLELAEEFLERYRQGQRPSLKEYIDRHPDLAAEIKEVFPAMALMENIALADESLAGEASGVASAPREAPPEQLGDFRILREVGRGGMGIVYEAEQMSLGRHVALKVLPRNALLDATHKRRFEREAKAAAKLHHTNIVPVFGVGEHDGLPYYVMQFIQGLGLDEVLVELKRLRGVSPSAGDGILRVSRKDVSAVDVARSLLTGAFSEGEPAALAAGLRTPQPADNAAGSPEIGSNKLSDSFTLSSSSVNLPASRVKGKKPTYWQSVAQIGVQVADALEHAHKQRILHRDIKPSNLLLDTRGTVWVADFGLARAETEAHLTQTGDIVGTLRYMPPEAFEGRTDARSDLYSLGLTLYELLALRPAFEERDRHKLIKRVTTEEPPRLDKLNRQAPRDLVTIVHKAIDREPARRYATAAELAADLQHFIDDEPIRARRVGLVERAWRWCRHNPALASALGLAAAALLAVTVLATLFALTEADFARQQSQSNEELHREQERTQTVLHELRTNSAWAAVQRGQSLLEQNQLSHGLLWLARGLELAPAEDGNLPHTIRTNLASLRGELPLLRVAFAHPYSVHTTAFSPDGRIVALGGGADEEGEVRLFDAATGKPINSPLPHPGVVYIVEFSPDGKTLLVGGRGGGRFWDVAAGKEIDPPLELRNNFITFGAFSPDGQMIALGTWGSNSRGQTLLCDAATHKPIGQPLGPSGAAVYSLAFSPDGKTLAAAVGLGTGRGECRLWDVASRKARGKAIPHPAGIIAVAFSPDGKTLATTEGRGMKARLWDAATGKAKGKPFDHQGDVYALSFSPDGRILLTSGGGMVRLWRVESGQPLGEPLPGPSHVALRVPFSPDGQSILIPGADKTARLWSLPSGRQVRPPLMQPGGVSALALSRDGQRLLVRSGSSGEGELRLWDVARNKPIGPARRHVGWYYAPVLSPDGKTVLMGSENYGTYTARLWDGTSGQPIGEPLVVPGYVYSVAFSPDGKTFLASSYETAGRKNHVHFADAASGQAIGPPLRLPGTIWKVAFSPDGKTFLTSNGVTGFQEGELRFWDAGTRKEIGRPIRHRGKIGAIAFSPDGKILATGSRDGIARLWNAANGEAIGPPLVHQGEVNAIAFSPDGSLVATASDDSKVRFWSAATARPIGTPLMHARPVNSVVFSRDGTTLLSGSDDRTIRFWQVPNPLTGEIEPIKAWAEWSSGMTLSSEGAVSELEASAWDAQREKLAGGERQPSALANPFAPAAGHGFTAHLRQALDCMDNEDWQSALWHLDREIDAQPNAWLAYVWRTRVRIQLGRYDRAAEDFDKALQLDSGEQALHCYRAYAAESADKAQWQTAFWYLDRLIAARPQEAALYLDRGRAYQKRGQRKKAIEDYDEALKREPNDPRVWLEKSRLDINLGRWAEAAKASDKCLQLDPSDHWAWYQSTSLHLYLGDVDGYRRQCQEMLRRFGQTDNPMTAERTAKTCLLLPDAVADQETVQRLAQRAATGTEKHTYYGWYLLTKGVAEYRAGNLEQAIHWLNESQKHPNSSQVAPKAFVGLFLSMAHQRLGHAEQARQAFQQAAALIDAELQRWKTDEASVKFEDWLKAMIVRKEVEALREGKLPASEQALALRQKSAQADPKNKRLQADLAASQHALALVLLDLGKRDEAQKHLQQAIALRETLVANEPKNGQYQADLTASRFALGDVSWRSGRLAEGAKQWQRGLDALETALRQGGDGVSLTGQLVVIRRTIGQHYARAGLWSEAAAHYERLLSLKGASDNDYFRAACLALRAGNTGAYRRVCAAIVKRIADVEEATRYWGFAWACGLADNAEMDRSRLLSWAQKRADNRATEDDWPTHVLALAHYRAGQFAEAITQANKSDALNPYWRTHIVNWPLLAMAHHRLGHAAEARQWLEKSTGEWRRLSPLTHALGGTTVLPTTSAHWQEWWANWAAFEILLREASLLIAGAPLVEDAFDHAHRGLLYSRLGENEKAETEWQAAIKIAPREPALPLAHARAFVELGQHDKADADFAKAAALTSDELNKFLESGWWVIGPYPEDLKLPCPPEKNPDPSRPIAAVGNAEPLHWQPATTEQNGRLNLRTIFNADHISAYALNYVYSPNERTATLYVGGDDRGRVWLNGRLVHESNRLFPGPWGADHVPVTLKAGRNTLLCKVSQDKDRHFLYLRMGDNLFDRATVRAQLGLWDEAAALFARAIDRQPSAAPNLYTRCAQAQLLVGDTAGYRRYVDRMFERYDQDNPARDWLVYAGGLLDGTVKTTRLIELADRALENGNSPFVYHAAGIAYYRAGQFDKAIGRLEESLKNLAWQKQGGHASELGLALAHHRLGHAKEARQWLDKAEQWYEKAIGDALAWPYGRATLYNWADWPSFIVLRREAHKRILGADLPDDPRLLKLVDRMRDRLKKLDPATADYDAAILLYPGQSRLWQTRGRRLAELKRDKEAEADFRKAAELLGDKASEGKPKK